MTDGIIEIAKSSLEEGTSILLIYTGGTFGMVFDQKGQLIPFNFSNVLDRLPELHKLDLNISLLSFKEPVDSSNISIPHWQEMARLIYENYNGFDGFVVLHGTDTMAYSASVISFMLEGLRKPVIFTGAQIPIGATRSDARENLITALEIASQQSNGRSVVQEVCIFFNHLLLRGNRSQKVRSSNFGAFESENYPVLAEAGVDITFNAAYLYRPTEEKLQFHNQLDNRIALLKVFPEMHMGAVEAIVDSGVHCLIMESFGSGNVMSDPSFMKILEKAIADEIIVLNVSQCVGGNVIHGKYQTSAILRKIGVVSGHDMTTEAALAKGMHLLAHEDNRNEVLSKLQIPLRGELTI